jgi:hypothetical protein
MMLSAVPDLIHASSPVRASCPRSSPQHPQHAGVACQLLSHLLEGEQPYAVAWQLDPSAAPGSAAIRERSRRMPRSEYMLASWEHELEAPMRENLVRLSLQFPSVLETLQVDEQELVSERDRCSGFADALRQFGSLRLDNQCLCRETTSYEDRLWRVFLAANVHRHPAGSAQKILRWA